MQEVLERALLVSRAAEVYRIRSISTPVQYENNQLKKIDTSESSGLALRVIKDGKIGFSSSTKAGDDEALVERAVATARFGAPAGFEFPRQVNFRPVDCYDPEVLLMSIDGMVEMGGSIVERLRALHPELLAAVTVEKSEEEHEVWNSSGLHASFKRTGLSVFASAELVEGENFLSVYDGVARAYASIDVAGVCDRMAEKVRDGRRNVALPSGKYPVILTPLAMESLVLPLSASVNGKTVEKQISPFKDKLGEKVAAQRFTLYDDPSRPGSVSAGVFDGEGIGQRRLAIIEAGELKSFLLDLQTASVLKQEPTGSTSRRSIDRPPEIGPANLVIDPGKTPVASMIRDMRKGVIVDLLMGAWAGNVLGGAVNGNIMLGFVVDNGEVVGRCKDAMLSANAFAAFSSQLVDISSEQMDYGNVVFPYVLFDGMSVTTRS
jgi:PmbA protein